MKCISKLLADIPLLKIGKVRFLLNFSQIHNRIKNKNRQFDYSVRNGHLTTQVVQFNKPPYTPPQNAVTTFDFSCTCPRARLLCPSFHREVILAIQLLSCPCGAKVPESTRK